MISSEFCIACLGYLPDGADAHDDLGEPLCAECAEEMGIECESEEEEP